MTCEWPVPENKRPDPDVVASPPPTDISFDDIEIEDLLGHGGNADVHKATATVDETRIQVAVKQPRGIGTITHQKLESLLDEAETWQQLHDHPHIVGVVDYDAQPKPWIATEYMDGGNLRLLLDRKGCLPVAQALWIGRCLAQAVRHAHRHGYPHLDLKPENVLFREPPDKVWSVPKIADWGLSTHLAKVSSVEGRTPDYAAPEQADPDSSDNPDDYSDIYQLGVLVYEMLTGDLPYDAKGVALHQRIIDPDTPPIPPSERRSDLTPVVDAVVCTALEHAKDDRYETVVNFRTALEALQGDGRLPSVVESQLTNRPHTSVGSGVVTKHEITVVGCGGAGGNLINRIYDESLQGMKLVAANIDVQHLVDIEADSKILMGQQKTQGGSTGALPQVGEEAALEAEDEIYDQIQGSDIVFVTAGLGGGTGTGASPVIAKAARDCGAIPISIVTTPFSGEGRVRRSNAEAGLDRLRDASEGVIVISHDRLLDAFGNLPVREAWEVIDDLIVRSMRGITELISNSGISTLELGELRRCIKNDGVAMIGFGESDSGSRIQESVENALDSPSLAVDISKANSVLVNVIGGPGLDMKEAGGVIRELEDRVGSEATITWGSSINEKYDNEIETMIVAWVEETPQIYTQN